MALIVEDGTGKADAESFISVSDASTYHTARGNAAWAALASDTVREQYLRQATDYMQQVYQLRWAGYSVSTTQALSWPRSWVPIIDSPNGYGTSPSYYSDSAVPTAVKNACAEMALKASSGTLLADLTQQKKSVKIGPIETEFDNFSPQAKRYTAIDSMLRPYLSKNANQVQTVRA